MSIRFHLGSHVLLLALAVTNASASGAQAPKRLVGLMPQDNGQIVYDSNQGVYWLADANLAADPKVRSALNVGGISPDGTMDYKTALNWVHALNHYQQPGCASGQTGFLCHNNWQLPDTPNVDSTCSSIGPKPYRNHFGVGCVHSAFGSLYSIALNQSYPDSVAPQFTTTIGLMRGLKPSLYWTRDTNPGGQATFSFVTGIEAGNTTKYNYFYTLAKVDGYLGATKPSGSGLVAYPSAPEAGRALYDTRTNTTWLADASLAASNSFSVTGTTTITSVNGKTVTVPLISSSGAMLFDTAKTQWLQGMKNAKFAGTGKWELPTVKELLELFNTLGLKPGDTRFLDTSATGPFKNLQPFFYWTCERDDSGSSASPCNGQPAGKNPTGAIMQWSFNNDTGFQGTTKEDKPFHVMVYYAPTDGHPPVPGHTCDTPESCCVLNGGVWTDGRCE